jgi:hypothetical protein|tara:strand:+ start:4266 stop:4415 length:150 start_codon:yes stop_codon:yes gene_type:complete
MTGQLCIYLGMRDELHLFYSSKDGIVERWHKILQLDGSRGALEVINEAR